MEVEDVNVELGFIVVRVAISEALADRMTSTHSSRSSLLAVGDDQLPLLGSNIK